MTKSSALVLLCGLLGTASVEGCGRDALSVGADGVTLQCPVGNDDTRNAGAFSGSSPLSDPAPPSPQTCLFEGTRLNTFSNLEAFQELITGTIDPSITERFAANGFDPRNEKDRSAMKKELQTSLSLRTLSDAWVVKWLGLPSKSPSVIRLPEALWSELREQTLLQGRAVFINQGLPLTALITSTQAFATAEVAQHYGLPFAANGGFTPVKLPSNRPGVLGHVSVLASHPSVSSRGELLAKRFLSCEGAPPPPAVDRLHPVNAPSLAARQELDAKLSAPNCKGCHTIMEIGFVLHGFDERGLERKLDSDGRALDTTVEEPFGGRSVSSLGELASLLEEDSTWKSCLGQALMETAISRIKSTPLDAGGGTQTEVCTPGNILAQTFGQTASLDAALDVVATMIFGGELRSSGGDPMPPIGVKPMFTSSGRLSACLPITRHDLSCGELCQNNASSCTDERSTCTVADKTARAFFFASKTGCERAQVEATLSSSCTGSLGAAACNSPAALSWVRCCCDGPNGGASGDDF